MLYHPFIHINLLCVGLNLLRHLVMLFGLLAHFVPQFFEVLLHQVILIINDSLIIIYFLLQLLKLQRINPISHHIYLFLDHIRHVLVLILGKHLHTLNFLIQLVMGHSKLILKFAICVSKFLAQLLFKFLANVVDFDFADAGFHELFGFLDFPKGVLLIIVYLFFESYFCCFYLLFVGI